MKKIISENIPAEKVYDAIPDKKYYWHPTTGILCSNGKPVKRLVDEEYAYEIARDQAESEEDIENKYEQIRSDLSQVRLSDVEDYLVDNMMKYIRGRKGKPLEDRLGVIVDSETGDEIMWDQLSTDAQKQYHKEEHSEMYGDEDEDIEDAKYTVESLTENERRFLSEGGLAFSSPCKRCKKKKTGEGKNKCVCTTKQLKDFDKKADYSKLSAKNESELSENEYRYLIETKLIPFLKMENYRIRKAMKESNLDESFDLSGLSAFAAMKYKFSPTLNSLTSRIIKEGLDEVTTFDRPVRKIEVRDPNLRYGNDKIITINEAHLSYIYFFKFIDSLTKGVPTSPGIVMDMIDPIIEKKGNYDIAKCHEYFMNEIQKFVTSSYNLQRGEAGAVPIVHLANEAIPKGKFDFEKMKLSKVGIENVEYQLNSKIDGTLLKSQAARFVGDLKSINDLHLPPIRDIHNKLNTEFPEFKRLIQVFVNESKIENLINIFEHSVTHHLESVKFDVPKKNVREAIIENIIQNPDNWRVVRNSYSVQEVVDLYKANHYCQSLTLGEAKQYFFDSFRCSPKVVEEAYRALLIKGKGKYQTSFIVEDALDSLPQDLKFEKVRFDKNLVKEIVRSELKENRVQFSAEQLMLIETHFGMNRRDIRNMNDEIYEKVKNFLDVSSMLDENAKAIAESNVDGDSLERLRRANLKIRKQLSKFER